MVAKQENIIIYEAEQTISFNCMFILDYMWMWVSNRRSNEYTEVSNRKIDMYTSAYVILVSNICFKGYL